MWVPERQAALMHNAAFAPFMGGRYAARRNTDFGPDDRSNISLLSPYLRRRLINEKEVVAAALETHGAADSEKFIQEVFWRSYFKGWLEQRPGVWKDYLQGLEGAKTRFKRDLRLERAEGGETGIDCFDFWARELTETNYLHNHARMWFASIWIFTLELPWQLGADFFLRHLLDGDPASNTLSWRWVAGLHTRGKNYIAVAQNIARFTNGRFMPDASQLAQDPEPLTETYDYGPAGGVRSAEQADPSKASGLLLTLEDCSAEHCNDFNAAFRATATLQISPDHAAETIRAFDAASLADAAIRAQKSGAPEADKLDPDTPRSLVTWAQANNILQVVTPYIPVGPTRDWVGGAMPYLDEAGITLVEIQRDWDQAVWPSATAGFFKIKKKIPRFLADFYRS